MKNKGITLVALVITIIILLILAGITISQLTNSGLFNNVQTAKSEHENAQEREDEILKQYENAISTGEVTSDRDTITIPKEEYDKLKLINKPNLWEANTKEYDLGDGLYGRRFVGTITVSTKSTRTNIVLTEGPIKTIINAGGCVNYTNGDAGRGLYIGYSIETYQHDNGYFCGIYTQNESGKAILSLATASNDTYPIDIPYDVWITYTK